jgi:hypothetical protein
MLHHLWELLQEEASERTKLSMLRQVAERLVSAKNETAMLTTFNEEINFVMNSRRLKRRLCGC